MHQSIPPAPSPPPPGATAVPGVGHLQMLYCPGPGICQPPGQSFDTHAVSYPTVLQEEKQIGSFVKDRNKL